MSTEDAEMDIPGRPGGEPTYYPMWMIEDDRTGLRIDDHRLVMLVNTSDRGWQPTTHWGKAAIALANKLIESGALSIAGWLEVTD